MDKKNIFNSVLEQPFSISGKLAAFVLLMTISLVLINGCDQFTGHIDGEVTENVAPWVEFANVPSDSSSFRYAPVIYWKGGDEDGFVEYFEYADITDSAAISNPLDFIELIPPEAWVRTYNNADTVFLLAETGDITEHVFYLRCVDDRDEESQVIYRTFFRTNDPPNVPVVKWYSARDEDFANDVVLEDTLYCLGEVNETWPGLGFNWRSNDPDDRDLYTIPLEYRYYLEKVPHDTIWQWVAPEWSNEQDIVITGLETGHYTFTVWTRDDGLEMCDRPASITFDVYKPQFEEQLLIVDCSKLNPPPREGLGNVIPGSLIGDYYKNLVETAASDIVPEFEYIHSTEIADTFFYKAYLGRFQLVMYIGENGSADLPGPKKSGFEASLRSYAHVGGRIWAQGNFVGSNLLTNSTLGLAESSINTKYSVPNDEAEFMGATAAVTDLPDITIDTSKTSATWEIFFTGGYSVAPLLPGVDVLTAGSGSETTYYFQSYTDTASGDVVNDTAKVIMNADTIYFPPTPIGCLIKLGEKRVREVTRVENLTRGTVGEVVSLTNNVGTNQLTIVRVSYDSGEPWALEDIIQVDYEYLPYSDNHFKPCGLRYERIAQSGSGYEVRYRVAAFTFPLYFMDNSNGSVDQMFRSMLRWFYLPFAH